MSLTQTSVRRPSHSRTPSAEIELPVRPPSRSERLLRETLVRDSQQRAPRSLVRRAESYPTVPRHLPDLFDRCADDDEDDDLALFTRTRAPVRRASRSVGSPSRSPDAAAERTRAWVELAPNTPPSPVQSHASLALSRRPSAPGRPRHHTHPPATPPRSALAHLSALQSSPMPAPMQARQARSASCARASSDRSSDSSAASTPQTPPPAPAIFDAHVASTKLRETAGYVSFSDVEGLGIPPEDESVDEKDHRGWFRFGPWGRA
ncbi:hypothetical protein K488DRAFT_72941 [Vararia minispora EC-137]|uniref:Uncharacterized protein n=1 Tax=Vararia minispora EC-137 TaxID=1314806 RepID=A0ACB8QD06_9AGAM|nr:hypothetical protein K488DRAFT_72941 [Vararia minispora EC-137]